jgi:dipeptidyl aminopeptidase/acylaminoacyl peptidase
MGHGRRWAPGLAGGAAIAAALTASAHAGTTERELTFEGAGGFGLRGTLLLPEGASVDDPAPAMLLVAGSGPTDRDGNQPPMIMTNMLRQIAEGLGEAGVATLRFDKRAVQIYAVSWPPMDEIAPFFSYENFVGDVGAAFDAMRSAPEVDPGRAGILGHSQGGLYALEVASRRAGGDDRPAALVLASTAGRSLDVVILEQVRAQFERAGMAPELREDWLGTLAESLEKTRRQAPLELEKIPAPLRGLFNPSVMELLPSLLATDPARLAADVRGPVLVIQGDMDAQISVERDLPALADALEARDAGETERVVVENGSHSLKASAGEGDPGFAGPMLDDARDAIVRWVVTHLAE